MAQKQKRPSKLAAHFGMDWDEASLHLGDMLNCDPAVHFNFTGTRDQRNRAAQNTHDCFPDVMIPSAKTPDHQKAVALAVLATCKHGRDISWEIPLFRGELLSFLRDAVDIPHANQGIEVWAHLSHIQPAFAHKIAAVVGKGLLGTSPRAIGWESAVATFSNVCKKTDQSALAVKVLGDILVRHKFGPHYLDHLRINDHPRTGKNLITLRGAFRTMAASDDAKKYETAPKWEKLVQGINQELAAKLG